MLQSIIGPRSTFVCQPLLLDGQLIGRIRRNSNRQIDRHDPEAC